MRTQTVVLLLLLGLLCAVQSPAAAQVHETVPDTPAATEFSAWLSAFNSGDRAAYSDFLQKNFPSRAKFIDQDLNFRETTGGFVLRKVEESSATQIVALMQERDSDQFARLVLEVQPTDPRQITRLELRAIPRPAEFPLLHMSQKELIRALRTKLEQASAADRFSGAVLVAKNGKPIFAGAYGLADREHGTPNTLKTRFRVGSMNKMFTATAILQLAQEAKLRLDDPLVKYLPDYPNEELAARVTLSQLLSHTGGTGDIFGPEFQQHRLELRTLDDYVKLYGSRGLGFEPGTRWEYSNYGYILLGEVVEKVSGESYYDCVRDRVFKPARMTSTGSDPENETVANRSVGYAKIEGSWKANTDTLPYRGTSAGGGYSTVGDLLRFANALQEHKLLDPQFTELLTTGKVDMPGGGRYGYGFGERTMNGIRCFGHNGGAPGMSGDLEICPQSGYAVIVLANIDPPAADRVSQFVVSRLPEPKAYSHSNAGIAGKD